MTTEAGAKGLPSTTPFPRTLEHFRQAAGAFSEELRGFKKRLHVADSGWYLYDSLSTLPLLSDLATPSYPDLYEAISKTPVVADIGCGDGDLAVFFSRMGCEVDAIDHAETNFNQLRGVEVLRREMSPGLRGSHIDLHGPFVFPPRRYRLGPFFGTL